MLSKSGPMCDDCLSIATHIKPRQAINSVCRTLVSRNELKRKRISCPVCAKTKIVNQLASDLSFSLALEQLVQRIAEGEIEIYNEFSLQHELGIMLRNYVQKDWVQFERNVSHFDFKNKCFVKREIDIVVYDPETKALNYAIELKFPRNGQYPEQMFSFCEDIVFMEQVKKAGFARTYVVIFVDNALFYEGGRRSDGIYGYFRGSEKLHGSIRQPTGKKNKTLHIKGSYQVNWLNVNNRMKYTVIEAE